MLAITRCLYSLGYTPEQVRLAFRFVDWLLCGDFIFSYWHQFRPMRRHFHVCQ
jgi:hypothetical protein